MSREKAVEVELITSIYDLKDDAKMGLRQYWIERRGSKWKEKARIALLYARELFPNEFLNTHKVLVSL